MLGIYRKCIGCDAYDETRYCYPCVTITITRWDIENALVATPVMKQWTTSSGTFAGELEREVVGEGATPVTKQWTTLSGTFAGELEREVVGEGGSSIIIT